MNWLRRPSGSAPLQGSSTRTTRTALSVLIAAILAGACHSVPEHGFSTARLALPSNTTVGIRSTTGPLEVDSPEHLSGTDGAPRDAAQGALLGTLAMSLECLSYLWFVAPVCAVVALAGGVEGAKLGTRVAEQATTAETARNSLLPQDPDITLHNELRRRMLNLHPDDSWLPLVDLGEAVAPDAAAVSDAIDGDAGPGAIVEVGVHKITISSTGGDDYGFTALAKSRIIDARDGTVLGEHDHLYIGPSMTRQDLSADDGRRLRDTLSLALDQLAHDILERCCRRQQDER